MSRMPALAIALLALIGLPRPGSAAEAVVLQLHAPAQFEFAGYYAAQWLGYYRDAGLSVEIRPGGARAQVPIDPVREVAEGRAQFGTGTMQLVIRSAQGLPLLLVAPIFQQSGAAVYYRADSDFSSPAALVKARLGRLPASDILDIELATALRAEGIDPAKIKAVSVEPSKIVAALADKSVDAVAGSAWTTPWQAHERGIILKSFNPANYRVEYYGDSLFTVQRFAAAEPETVRRFRAASLKGWEYALQNPDEIAARLIAERPGEPPVADVAGFARYQADVAKRLSRYPEIPLGYSNLDRWTQIEAGMLGAGVLTRSADLTSFVDNPSVVDNRGPEAASRIAGSGRAAVLIGIALAVVAALAGLALRFRRRQPAAANEAPALAEPALEPARVIHISRPAVQHPPPPPPPVPPTDLNAVLAPLERRIRQRVRGKVRCRFSLLPQLWPCRTSGGVLVPIVLDLCGAAAAVMDRGGNLIVGTRNFTFDPETLDDYPGGRIGEFARITVRDNGRGLTEAEFERILDPGASARPALAAAAIAVEKIGGFVRVESAEGVGTAVHLYFARATDADTALHDLPKPAAEVAE
jgi:ABC-type nitrate/sulfonate/bicarbonate transport system substrate-binding protein